jgi:hypothetical protein
VNVPAFSLLFETSNPFIDHLFYLIFSGVRQEPEDKGVLQAFPSQVQKKAT